MKARNNLKPVYVCVLLALSVQTALANPLNPSVVNGQASFATTGNALTVTNTPGAIINWQGFSIGANEITRFAQQSASSAVLNRVISNNPSSILGTLQSNGQVFLVNPNGIVFGAGATIDVAGLMASTLSLGNADFLAGRYHFTQVPGAANISNAGNITAQNGGQIFLIAPNVENTGVITAPNGEILLAAGYSVDLVSTANPSLRVSITAPAGDATNIGQLIAQSGSLGLFGTVVRNSGTVSADSATMQGGKIVFKASGRVEAGGIISAQGAGGGNITMLADMQTGTVNVSGKLDASAPNRGNGGFIETSAAHVNVANTASVTTYAGNGSSGTWLIDPLDFYIAATGGNITGATVSTSLGAGNVVIMNAAGAGNGDIFVNDAVSWNSAFNLTLNATRNVDVNQAITNLGAGAVNLRADFNGACVAGALTCGTVNFASVGHVTAATTNIYYNPVGSNTAAGANGAGPTYAVSTIGLPLVYTIGFTPVYTTNVTGTLNSYMLVNDVNQLQAINTNLTGSYALGTNIDATATSTWNPATVGLYNGFAPVGGISAVFTGQFDGLNHTISNLFINRPAQNQVGLFGYTYIGSVINNVGLVGGSVAGSTYTGALVGLNNSGSISNAYATGNVNGGGVGGGDVGGLVGLNQNGTISNSYATGHVTGTGSGVGGLLGFNFVGGAINNSYATGSVTGGDYAGGLAGKNSGTINNSYATGSVNGGSYVGGLVGFNGGSTVSAGGTINNSYATGSVTGVTYVGGLAGNNDFYGGTISNSYSAGSVSGVSFGGGLVGLNSGTVSNSFWDTQTSGQATSTGGTGLTTAQMMAMASFAGWNIANTGGASAVWRIYEGNTYPLLTSFLTPLNVLPSYDGSGMALTNIGSYTLPTGADASKILGSAANSLTLSSTAVGSYTASLDAGLYSTQQGYDLTVSRSIATPGSAAGNIVLSNPVAWTNGTLNVSTTGTIYANAAISGGAGSVFNLQSGTWNQVSATLPGFTVNDFRITGGTFIRALGGDGSSSAPYQLADIYGLQGMGSTGMLGNAYVLTSNIDATGTLNWNAGAGFLPVGNATTNFTGQFDGLNHTISNLTTINITQYEGLFGVIGVGGIVSDVGLIGSSVIGACSDCSGVTGALAGYNQGTISNSYASNGSVSVGSKIGGLVGWNAGAIIDTYASGGTVGGGDNLTYGIGGLVGYNTGSIANSYASNSVSVVLGTSSTVPVGGLVGFNGSMYSYAGGTVSYAGGTVSNSFWDTQTSGQATSTGGTGLTTAQMMAMANFTGWSIANTGGAGMTWRIYEGQTYPLLTSFLTPLTVTASSFTKSYDGLAYSGGNGVTYSIAAPTLSGTVVYGGTSQGAVDAGSYVIAPGGLFSDQQGYDVSYVNGVLTVNPAAPALAPGIILSFLPDMVNSMLIPGGGASGSSQSTIDSGNNKKLPATVVALNGEILPAGSDTQSMPVCR